MADVFYYLIGECGSEYDRTNSSSVVLALKMGITLIANTIGPPPGSGTLEVLWAEYNGNQFPTIAIALTYEATDANTKREIEKYEREGLEILIELNNNVNWRFLESFAPV